MDKPVHYYRNDRTDVADLFPEKYKTVLEVGCGEGDFRKYASAECEYWGVEPFLQAASIAEKRLNKVLALTFDAAAEYLPDNYFDVIVCNDVIEHLTDHNLFLQQAKRKLKENGVIIGSLPNIRYIKELLNLIKNRDWQYTDCGVLDYTHLRFFTKKSIEHTFLENGFTLDVLDGIHGIRKFRKKLKFRKPGWNFLIFLFGKDTRFIQYRFRICPK